MCCSPTPSPMCSTSSAATARSSSTRWTRSGSAATCRLSSMRRARRKRPAISATAWRVTRPRSNPSGSPRPTPRVRARSTWWKRLPTICAAWASRSASASSFRSCRPPPPTCCARHSPTASSRTRCSCSSACAPARRRRNSKSCGSPPTSSSIRCSPSSRATASVRPRRKWPKRCAARRPRAGSLSTIA